MDVMQTGIVLIEAPGIIANAIIGDYGDYSVSVNLE